MQVRHFRRCAWPTSGACHPAASGYMSIVPATRSHFSSCLWPGAGAGAGPFWRPAGWAAPDSLRGRGFRPRRACRRFYKTFRLRWAIARAAFGGKRRTERRHPKAVRIWLKSPFLNLPACLTRLPWCGNRHRIQMLKWRGFRQMTTKRRLRRGRRHPRSPNQLNLDASTPLNCRPCAVDRAPPAASVA